MNQEPERDTLRPEYDFSAGVRGTHHRAYRQGTNVVLLEPDVAAVFKDAAAVNSALRACAGRGCPGWRQTVISFAWAALRGRPSGRYSPVR